MAQIINPSRQDVTLPTGHIVPRTGALTTTNDVLRCADNVAFLDGQTLSGALTVEYDPDTDAVEVSVVEVSATVAPQTIPDPAPVLDPETTPETLPDDDLGDSKKGF